MPVPRKGAKKETGAPVINLAQAKCKILEAELYLEPYTITRKDGSTFEKDPHVNMKIEIIDDFADGEYDSMVFYDSAVLKQDEDGDWIIRDGTKAGTIAKARYGNDFFETDEVFDEADLEGFVFMCAIEPKKHRETGAVTGSMMVWNTIMKLPVPKKKAKTNGRGTTGELVPGTDAENLDMDLAPEEEEAMRGALG